MARPPSVLISVLGGTLFLDKNSSRGTFLGAGLEAASLLIQPVSDGRLFGNWSSTRETISVDWSFCKESQRREIIGFCLWVL